MAQSSKFVVGQTVFVDSVNRGTRPMAEGTVTKVGTKLVYVQYGWSHSPQAFRIDGGHANDQYGHQWVLTVDEHIERVARAGAKRRLAAHDIKVGSRVSTEVLNQIADLLDQAQGA